MFNSKVVGGVLLIVGTSIGAGMLALPLALSTVSLPMSLLLLFLAWLVMYLGARFMLEVNLQTPVGTHIVSMAKQTLGRLGQVLAWFVCLALLYSLLSGYISAGSDVLKRFLWLMGYEISGSASAIFFTAIFSLVVYMGIHMVDYVNRFLMFGKLGIYCLLIVLMTPKVHLSHFHAPGLAVPPSSLMILITSFGFASIVPSLRYYFDGDAVLLRKVIFWGSLIPFVCYVFWNTVMLGVLSREGADGLVSISQMQYPLGGLIQGLEHRVGGGWFAAFFSLFTAICVLTAFLGVSLGLFDFVADGLSLRKKGYQGMATYGLTFLPPLLVVLVYPGLYLSALEYAGRCCVILLLLLPVMMAWRCYQDENKNFMIPGGKVGLFGVGLAALFLLYLG